MVSINLDARFERSLGEKRERRFWSGIDLLQEKLDNRVILNLV
jgi:hypothetical protein